MEVQCTEALFAVDGAAVVSDGDEDVMWAKATVMTSDRTTGTAHIRFDDNGHEERRRSCHGGGGGDLHCWTTCTCAAPAPRRLDLDPQENPQHAPAP